MKFLLQSITDNGEVGRQVEIQDQLRHAIEELGESISSLREDNADEHEVQQRLDTFELAWQERLSDAEEAELRGGAKAIGFAMKEVEHLQRLDQYEQDAALLPAMNKEDQVAFWQSNHLGEGNQLWASERERLATRAHQHFVDETNRRYDKLRHGLEQAADCILEGKAPELSFTLTEQIAKEQDTRETQAIVNEMMASRRRNREEEREH